MLLKWIYMCVYMFNAYEIIACQDFLKLFNVNIAYVKKIVRNEEEVIEERERERERERESIGRD